MRVTERWLLCEMRVTPVTVLQNDEAGFSHAVLGAVGQDDFGMADAAVEAGEQGSCLIRDDGGFDVGACEGADGFEGTPVGLDEDFDFVFCTVKRYRGSHVTSDAAKFRQNAFGEMFEIFL